MDNKAGGSTNPSKCQQYLECFECLSFRDRLCYHVGLGSAKLGGKYSLNFEHCSKKNEVCRACVIYYKRPLDTPDISQQ